MGGLADSRGLPRPAQGREPEVYGEKLSDLGKGGRGGARRGCWQGTPRDSTQIPARMQINHEVEQDHYLGAQRFVTPHHWLQGAKPGPVPPVPQGGGKYVACSDGIWP